MKKIILLILLLFFCDEISYCAEGGYAGSFLRMGVGARPKALGGAFVAVADDSYAAYYNPAGLPYIKDRYVNFSFMFLSLDRKLNYFNFSQTIKPSGGISIGWINAGVGNLYERSSEGEKGSIIDYSENAFCFSFAQTINKYISFGITGKLLYHKLYQLTAKGFGFDFAILAKPVKNLRLGFIIKDVNSGYSWNSNEIYERGTSTENNFISVTKAGTSYYIEKHQLLFAFDIEKNQKSDSKFHLGLEKTFKDQFSLRSGINDGNLCFGGGLKISLFGKMSFIDYSFENVEFDESPNQILTLTLSL
ncbi:PorV/PorQ family protein [candidate division KSB1 bacterium]